jgi:hypothetical protein
MLELNPCGYIFLASTIAKPSFNLSAQVPILAMSENRPFRNIGY